MWVIPRNDGGFTNTHLSLPECSQRDCYKNIGLWFCEQIWSDFSHSQCINHYYPTPPTLDLVWCFIALLMGLAIAFQTNVCAFYKFCCLLVWVDFAQLLTILTSAFLVLSLSLWWSCKAGHLIVTCSTSL